MMNDDGQEERSLQRLRDLHARIGLSGDEWAAAEQLCWRRLDRADVWHRALVYLEKGEDLVPAVLKAAFDAWPKAPSLEPGQEESLESAVYNRCAPEVKFMEMLWTAAGTRFLGGFVEFDHGMYSGSWCEYRTRDDGMALLERMEDESSV